jgi:hypothetical protein
MFEMSEIQIIQQANYFAYCVSFDHVLLHDIVSKSNTMEEIPLLLLMKQDEKWSSRLGEMVITIVRYLLRM